MLALSVRDSGVKDFMNKLLRTSLFDDFETKLVVLSGMMRFEISEEKQPVEQDSIDSSEKRKRKSCNWAQIKPHISSIIVSGGKPGYFKVVLALTGEAAGKINSNAATLSLNLLFDKGIILITTGVAQKSFSLDKSGEKDWDVYISDFLTRNEIKYESEI